MNDLLARALAAWNDLSGRERVLVSVSGGLAVLALLWVGVLAPIASLFDSEGNEIEAAEVELQTMTHLSREYRDVNARLESVEVGIKRVRGRRNLLTLLETLAGGADVKVDSMQKRQSGQSDAYRETKVEVSLKRVTLVQTVSYLDSVENAKEQLSVKRLRIKTRADAPDLLDVTFTVSSFEAI